MNAASGLKWSFPIIYKLHSSLKFSDCLFYSIYSINARAYKVIVTTVPVTLMKSGVVIRIEEDAYVLEGHEKRQIVEVHRDKLPKYCLPIKEGDTVEYCLAQALGVASAR